MTTVDRINELLKRAGHPMMVVLNEDNHGPKPAAYRTMAEAIDAYIKEQQRKDNNLIEILVAVLENVLNERDALMQDWPIARCHLCAHCYDEVRCDVPMDERGEWLGPCKAFVWRGVQDQEDAHEDT